VLHGWWGNILMALGEHHGIQSPTGYASVMKDKGRTRKEVTVTAVEIRDLAADISATRFTINSVFASFPPPIGSDIPFLPKQA